MDVETLFERLQKSVSKEAGVSVHKGGDVGISSHIPFYIPTGIPSLDTIIRGGWPAGKVIELYGFEKSGKTAAAMHAMAQCQAMGGLCLFVDTERSWDELRASKIGIDLNRVIVAETPTIEATFRVVEHFIENHPGAKKSSPTLIVVDSITGAATEDEVSNTLSTEARVGQEAKQIRRGVKRIVWQLADKKITILFVNHAVSKIAAWGKTSQAAGGHALKFMSTIRAEFKDIGKIFDNKEKTILKGQKVQIEIEKLKGASLREYKITVPLIDGVYDLEEGLFEAGLLTGAIGHKHKSKSYTLFPGTEFEHEFVKTDWPEVVKEFGGVDKLYKLWKEDAIEKGVYQPWA